MIDGRLEDETWSKYKPVSHLFNPDGEPMDIDSVWFYFAWDKENLKLARAGKSTSGVGRND